MPTAASGTLAERRPHMLHANALPLTLTAVGGALGAVSGLYAHRAVGIVGRSHPIAGTAPSRRALAALGLVLGAAIAARSGPTVLLPTYLLLVAAAMPLSAVDIAVHRLPDRLLLPATVACGLLLVAAAVHTHDGQAPLRAVTAAGVSFALFLALALVTGQMGFGDCKAAALCGLILGYQGWSRVLLSFLAAFIMAAVYITVKSVVHRVHTNRFLPFGPFLFAGAIILILVH